MIEVTKTELKLLNFPMSVSVNHMYKNNAQGIRYKQQGYKNFELEAELYFIRNVFNRAMGFDWTREIIKQEKTLHMETTFYVSESRCYTKKNTVKRHDVFNYVKSLIDVVCEGLSFDDRYIWSGKVKKAPINGKEYVDIIFREHEQ